LILFASKNILILCTDNYSRQPRVLRTIEALRNSYNLTVAGMASSSMPQVTFIDLSKNAEEDKPKDYWHFNKPFYIRLPVSFFEKYIKQKQFYKPFHFEHRYWTDAKKADLEQLKSVNADLIISHGIDTLPLAVKLAASKVPVIFNAHEYYLREFEENEHWLKYEKPYYAYILNAYMKKVDQMFCVCQTIQNDYQKDHRGLHSVVINNARDYMELKPVMLNANDRIRLIHHGAALRGRKLEEIIRIMEFLSPDYELNLMLVDSDKDYYNELKAKHSAANIKFIPTVAIEEIPAFINRFDIGVYILPPTNYNNLAALPNKFFDFIQARLCLCISPNIEMKAIVENYGIGKISENYTAESMAAAIRSLSMDDINACKQRTNESAAILSAEANKRTTLETIEKLLN
jgi:hypothetical protein